MEQPIQLSAAQFTQLMEQLTTRPNNNDTSVHVKPTRPSVDLETTEGEWAVFEDNWMRFKRMSKLTGDGDVRDNLRQCCSSQLNKRLFDVKGSGTLDNATEANLLQWIKEIAVKGVHMEVHRTELLV